MASADGGAMHTLQSHIEDMRSLTNCKICLKPFYEPYILACGHTYCYSCLRSWFLGRSADGSRSNKSCPDCRAAVVVQPAPNYAMRDLTHMFVRRAELIAEDETVDGHVKDMAEEADILNKDKNELGLFRGVFKGQPGQLGAWMRPLPINDLEDNVDRCPICAWEIEDGTCAGCGFDVDDAHDLDMSDMDDSEEDDDDEEDSEEDSVNSMPIGTGRPRSFNPRPFNMPQTDSDEEEDTEVDHSEVDQYDEHDDFIDNEIEVDADDIDNTHEVFGIYDPPTSPSSYGTTIYEEPFPFNGPQTPSSVISIRQGVLEESSSDVATNYDESDQEEDEEEDIRTARPQENHRSKRPRRPIVISDDEEDQEVNHIANEARMSSEEESEVSDDNSETSQETSDDDDDDDDDDNEEEEESDDTAIPPQTGHSRHERLVNHRARRPDKNTSRGGHNSVEMARRSRPERSRFRRIGATTRVY